MLDRLAPVERPGAFQVVGRAREGGEKQRVVHPLGGEVQDRRERGDIRLGRGHALLFSRAERQRVVGKRGERRGFVVHEDHHHRPGFLRRLRGRYEIGAAAGLRDDEEQAIAQVLLHPVDGRHRRRGRSGEHAQACLDHVFREGRGMVGAAARAGDHRAGRARAQRRTQARCRGPVALELRANRGTRLGRFPEHPRAGGIDDRAIHSASSATKS